MGSGHWSHGQISSAEDMFCFVLLCTLPDHRDRAATAVHNGDKLGLSSGMPCNAILFASKLFL